MRQEKKDYLKLYLLQESRLNRLKKLINLNPEFKEKYTKEIEKSLKLRQTIERQIEAVDGGILSELLYQKYVFGKTLESISYTLNYSTRHIERLHIVALDKFSMS